MHDTAADGTNVDNPFHGLHPHSRPSLEVSYRLGFKDMYWAYQSSAVGLICTVLYVGLGLMFFSALVSAPPGAPVGEDVQVGVLCLLLAPVFCPSVMILWAVKGVRSSARRGMHVRLRFDAEGIDGWAVPNFRETTWSKLRHPRMESRVLVLPFSWPFADSWVIIPARAFTPKQLEELLVILRARGRFLGGDHRSMMGRLMTLLLDRGQEPAGPPNELLHRFPRLAKVAREAPIGTNPSIHG